LVLLKFPQGLFKNASPATIVFWKNSDIKTHFSQEKRFFMQKKKKKKMDTLKLQRNLAKLPGNQFTIHRVRLE